MRAARWGALATMLALGGCGYSSAPDGYAPAADFDCGPLIGDWVLSGPGDLQWLAPERPLPDGVRFTFLSIEEDHNGQVRMVLRRRLGDVLAEATTMRLTHPDDYRRWRARTLHEPEPDGPLYATVQDAGPVVDIEMGQAFNACENGWRHSPSLRDGGRSGGDEPANQTYTLAFALDERRNLVVQQRVSREHGTDWSFFGQQVTYYAYSHSEWHRLLAVSPVEARAVATAADLPPVPSASQRLEIDLARRKTISDFPLWLRDHVPAGNEITLLREVQFDPAALALPADEVRFEVAGRFRREIEEPFTAVLRTHPQVHDIRIRQESEAPRNRRYVRVEFTVKVDVDAWRG